MNSTFHSRLLFYSFIVLSAILKHSCNPKQFESQRNLDFNVGWKFLEDSISGAEALDFVDDHWKNIDLPHDWSIEDPFNDSDALLFDSSISRGEDVGYLRGGTGWYRKTFILPQLHNNKEVILHFDGVMGETEIWINGDLAGEHVYGYTPFNLNITEYLNKAGEDNAIALRIYKPNQSSRWFTGAGVYRPVEISHVNPVHVADWGVFVKSELTNDQKANVRVEVALENVDQIEEDNQLHLEIISPDGSTQYLHSDEVIVPSSNLKSISFSLSIQQPELWSPENPSLYKAKVLLYEKGEQVDEYIQPFGIRNIQYSAKEGFKLNGKEMLLKGACLHHDNGILGAMAFQAAEERKVQIMKNNGFNAVRSSHNPPSKYFLEACDRLGMLVIDESFDMWIKPKRNNDYHQYFEEWWQRDLELMILRDRNHPSIIMWSFGNEVQERADSMGVEIGKNCIETIRTLDDSRPITQAVCGFWDNPGKVWDESAPAFEILDISGYNYQWANYKADHGKYPDRVMYGSESVPKEAFDNWQLVKQLPYVIGDFVWTGMDYIGESGIGHSVYPKPGDAPNGLMPWPTYVSWCGDIDLIGNKKPQSLYRDILWEKSKLEIQVHEPNISGYPEVVSFWGWPNELSSWNWVGHEKSMLSVSVYTSYPKVKLLLNGKEIGEQEVSENNRYTATFQVPYQPGELKAVGIVKNEIKEEKVLRTTGEVAKLELTTSTMEIQADRGSIAFVEVKAVDKDGFLVVNAETEISAKVKGAGESVASGNANPLIQGSFTDKTFSLFRGQGLIVVRSNGQKGTIKIDVQSTVLPSSSLEIIAQ